MTLYGSFTSPFVRHIRIALAQAGLDYNFVEIDNDASAKLSPSKRVPFMEDGEVRLFDSSSILLYLKQKAAQQGFVDVEDYELFCLANTALDTELNLFFLEKDGLGPEQSAYLGRQRARVASCLESLNDRLASIADIHNLSDGQLRALCMLEWGLFRKRFDVELLPNLKRFLSDAQSNEHVVASAPPR